MMNKYLEKIAAQKKRHQLTMRKGQRELHVGGKTKTKMQFMHMGTKIPSMKHGAKHGK
jgi:hypothetical protein